MEVGQGARTTALVYPAEQPRIGAALILGHGAGAGQHSPFMTDFAGALSALGADIITFNFLYTEQKRKLPDRAPALETCYRSVIEAVRDRVDSARHALFIGGKSMGGRIATQVAAADAELPLAGLVLLGYPLHPPGRPEKLRDAHLAGRGPADALRAREPRWLRNARRARADSRPDHSPADHARSRPAAIIPSS